MPADPSEWPHFEAPLLQAIAAAFLRRRRALRYHGSLECGRETSETPDGAIERLNLDHGANPQLRLSVWADGAMWLRACSARPGREGGWSFLYHFHGQVNAVSPEEIVRLFEESRLVSYWPEDGRGERLRSLWRVVGPEGGA